MNRALVKNMRLVKAPRVEQLPVPARTPSRLRKCLTAAVMSPWWWAAISCGILAISGGLRTWRDWEYESFAKASSNCPFPLKDLPRDLEEWQAIGPDDQLPEEIAKLAGSNSHILRTYKNKQTGEVVRVLVLYGIANSVFAHRPEACYAGAGFQEVGNAENGRLTLPISKTPLQYRLGYFSTTSGGVTTKMEVCHTFLHNKEWVPYLDSRWKLFRQHPAMCKIQIDRPGEKAAFEASPSLSLLQELAEAINRRMADAVQAAPGLTADTAKSS
jgi:hypothetical protein